MSPLAKKNLSFLNLDSINYTSETLLIAGYSLFQVWDGISTIISKGGFLSGGLVYGLASRNLRCEITLDIQLKGPQSPSIYRHTCLLIIYTHARVDCV